MKFFYSFKILKYYDEEAIQMPEEIRIKAPEFPTYEDWINGGCSFETKIGAYSFVAKVFSFAYGLNECSGGDVYDIAFGKNNNPMNIYAKNQFRKSFECEHRIGLERWYTETVAEMTEVFQDYIKEVYIE